MSIEKKVQSATSLYASRWAGVLLLVLAVAVSYGVYVAYQGRQVELRPVFLPPLYRPELPAPGAFEERPDLVAGIVDATLTQMADVQLEALVHLLHKARSAENVSSDGLPELTMAPTAQEERMAMRGQMYVVHGIYQKSWPIRLPKGNPSGLEYVTMGYLQPHGSETIFFVLEQDPAWDDFFTFDSVEVTGLFFKRYVDETLRLSGSLLVGRVLRRAALPEFVDDWEEFVEQVDDSESTGGIFILGADAYYYFLHKLLSEEPAVLSREAVPLDYSTLKAMIDAPQTVRGQAVRLRGQIAKSFTRKILPQPNRCALGSVWEGQIFIRLNGQDVLFVLNFPQRPEVVDGAVVEFEGYFVQRFAYKQAVGRTATVAPFLVGRGIRYIQ